MAYRQLTEEEVFTLANDVQRIDFNRRMKQVNDLLYSGEASRIRCYEEWDSMGIEYIECFGEDKDGNRAPINPPQYFRDIIVSNYGDAPDKFNDRAMRHIAWTLTTSSDNHKTWYRDADNATHLPVVYLYEEQ